MRKAKFVVMLLALNVSHCISHCISHCADAQEPASAASADSVAPADSVASATPTNDPRLDEIRTGSKAFVEAFNKADAATIAGMWTMDGEYADGSGNTFAGRDEIEKSYLDFFRNNADAKLQLNIDSLKVMSDAAVIEHGTSLVEVPPAAATVGRYEAIHVKVDGKWLMALVRDVVVDTAAARQNLSDLDFLIGTWLAEEQGNKTESVCSWVSDQGFVKREYTTTYVDGSQSSGVQLIGWNPQGGHLQSWSFSPDGGHAIGTWLPTEDGWAAQMQGMTGTGASTSSVNLLRRLDDNAYVWQSVDRTVDGEFVGDTNEVVIKRQP